ncbi:DNA-binding response regulator [Corallococcus praedator]|uniref:DNA-binding response regulator n=1 Tax=Corallococcus praedator TaxID=2316724 RepID=A0ABX9QA59_9BACT|nr:MULTISPECIES: response regulator transcription factor [Corallococcus]RKH11506.1 DNA-binding response regulator [Corallococcus sp. CA047B]RKH23220.1 DNA-binding response regulator [Corallococcus sp. CA031C]RKH97859.1 DNA-binding response regulator [Corallococcus praedator]
MRLLLVEDEAKMVALLRRGLEEEGHTLDVCARGSEALAVGAPEDYEVIVLDWSLPDMEGMTLLRGWRDAGVRTPVLMLTARGTTADKVLGLRSGADDYLVKPFDFEELLARLEVLRRRGEAKDGVVRLGELVLDPGRRVLRIGSREESLTAREFALFSALARHPGEARTRARLMEQTWGPDFHGSANVLDVYVGYLRTKLERLEATNVTLRSVRGVGYKLMVASPGGRAE